MVDFGVECDLIWRKFASVESYGEEFVVVNVVGASRRAVVAGADRDGVANGPRGHRCGAFGKRNAAFPRSSGPDVELCQRAGGSAERVGGAASLFGYLVSCVRERHRVSARAAGRAVSAPAYKRGPVFPAPTHHDFARDERTTFTYGRECVGDFATGVFGCDGLRLPVGTGGRYDRKRTVLAGEIDPRRGGGIMYATCGVPFAVPHGDESVGDVWIMPD